MKAVPARGQTLPLMAISARLAVDPVLLDSIHLVSYAVRIYLTRRRHIDSGPDTRSMVLVRSSWLCRELIQGSGSTHRCMPLREVVHDTRSNSASPGRMNSTRDVVALRRAETIQSGCRRGRPGSLWMARDPSGFDEFYRSNYKQRRDDYRSNSL